MLRTLQERFKVVLPRSWYNRSYFRAVTRYESEKRYKNKTKMEFLREQELTQHMYQLENYFDIHKNKLGMVL